MPHSALPNYTVVSHRQSGFEIAQAATQTGVSADQPVKTHTEARAEEHTFGEMPDPVLLFENSILVALIIVVFALFVKRRLAKVPHGPQNLAEAAVEFLNDFVKQTIGPGGEKYTPLVGTLFIYILLLNLMSAIPGFHSPTSNITITLALGVVVFVYVQYEGIRAKGVRGHVRHFAGPMPWLSPLLMPIELISELVKPFTLAIRLFGNIFGEDVIIVVLASLANILAVSTGLSWLKALGWLPVQFPVLLLSILTDLVQALVFAVLTCIYISLVTHHDDAEEHGAAHGTEAAHAAPAH